MIFDFIVNIAGNKISKNIISFVVFPFLCYQEYIMLLRLFNIGPNLDHYQYFWHPEFQHQVNFVVLQLFNLIKNSKKAKKALLICFFSVIAMKVYSKML